MTIVTPGISESSPGTTLSVLDRYLTVWIVVAMALGVALGLGGIHLPSSAVAVGLILMMYAPFTRVRYEALPAVFRDVRLLGLSMIQNWLIGPVVMFGLAVVFLSHRPEYFAGLVFIGLARCIAMVVVWNDMARGDREYTAALIALNSIFQIGAYAALAYLFITILPPLIGLPGLRVNLSPYMVMQNVALYLGVPFAAGILTRRFLRPRLGPDRYDNEFVPRVAPLTLVALLFTIVAMFSLQGQRIFAHPFDVLAISIPLALYFLIMFFVSFIMARMAGASYERMTALALSAASNNFELAIAVSVAVFGLNSGEAFATVIGPLIEVPVMLILVRVALACRPWLTRAVA